MSIAAGFADPALDAQATFRCLLEALAHPGRVVKVPRGLPAPPAPLLAPAYAVALTLLDFETPLWLDPALATPEVIDTLRLQCGCPIVPRRDARFALLTGTGAPLAAFDQGTPEYPDRSATLIWQVDALADDRGACLSGPGIQTSTLLQLEPVGPELLTGGRFGPEASLVGVAAELLGIALLWWWASRRSAGAGGMADIRYGA